MGARRTFPKKEKLYSRKLITELFDRCGNTAMTAYPIRVVFKQCEEVNLCRVLISVPKRCLHRANKRNRVKRQLREAYRKNKELVEGKNLLIAIIWLDSKTWSSAMVEKRVVNLLTRIKEKLANAE